MDEYKSRVKKDLIDWLASLREKNILDFLIIVVMTEEARVKAKILRNSVYDKIKADFCNKSQEKCIILTDPLKNYGKATESWTLVFKRTRQLLLDGITNCLMKFEDNMRAEREGRNQLGWSFFNYFLLQVSDSVNEHFLTLIRN